MQVIETSLLGSWDGLVSFFRHDSANTNSSTDASPNASDKANPDSSDKTNAGSVDYLSSTILYIPPAPPAITDAAVSRHRPTLNAGSIEGTLRVFSGETFAINGGFQLTSDLYLVGTPTILTNGGARYGGKVIDGGAAQPSNYQVTLNGAQLPGKIHLHADALQLPSDIPSAVPAPTATRVVNINSSADVAAIGNWGTVRDLNVNKAGLVINVPPGNYRRFSVNAASRLNFTAGVYNFSDTLYIKKGEGDDDDDHKEGGDHKEHGDDKDRDNHKESGGREEHDGEGEHKNDDDDDDNHSGNGPASVQSTGYVTINIAQSFDLDGGRILLGTNTKPGDVRLNVLGARVDLSQAAEIYGLLRGVNAQANLNQGSVVHGQVIANYLNMNGGKIAGDTSVTPPPDTTPPTISFTSPANNSTTTASSTTVSGTVSDTGANASGVAQVTVNGAAAVLDASTGQWTLAAVALSVGQNLITVRADDRAGNQTVKTVSVKRTSPPDTTPPVVTIVTPQNGTETYDPSVSVIGTATDDGLNATGVRQVTVNGRAATYDANTHQWTIAGIALSFGDNAVTVVAADGAPTPNQGQAVIHVKRLKVAPPLLTISNPQNGAVLSASSMTVAGNVTSASPDALNVTVDGQNAEVSGGQYTQIVTLSEGSNSITVVAADSLGQRAQSSVSVIRDQTPPSVALSAPASVQPGGSYQILVDATDNVGVGDVEFRVNGESIAKATSTPYQFTLNVPSALAPGNILTLTAIARDLTGSTAVATARTQTTGPGGISGYAFDDSTGYALEGATAMLNAESSTTSDAGGAFNFVSSTPSGIVRLSKTGFTPVERIYGVAPGEGAALFDARLTPLDAQSNTIGASGGDARGDGGRLSVSFGAGVIAADTDVRVTSVSPQGLANLLPFGWSPVPGACVDVRSTGAALPDAFHSAARLTIAQTHGLSSDTPLVLARYDETSHGWMVVAANVHAGSDGALEANLKGAGQYAFLVADTGSTAPPAANAGQALTSAKPADSASLDSATATAVASPRTAAFSPSARSTISFLATSGVQLPSGVSVEANYDETYNLLGGRDSLLVDRPAHDFVLYAYPTATAEQPNRLGAFFIAKPTRTDFSVTELLSANVHVEIRSGRQAKVGVLVGDGGGRLRAGNGAQLTIPANALTGQQPVFFNDVQPDLANVTLPVGYELLAAFDVNLTGATLGHTAAISLPSVAGDLSHIVVARLLTVGGQRSPKVVARAVDADGILTSITNAPAVPAGVALDGIKTSGRYVFIRIAGDFGYVKGIVGDAAGGSPVGMVKVSVDRTPFVDVTGSDGRYALIGSAAAGGAGANALNSGANALSAAAVNTDATGRGAATLASQDALADVPITLATVPLAVESVTPADGARNMIATTPVTVSFNKPVTPASLTASTFTLTTAAGNPVLGTINTLAGNRVAVFTPSSSLTGSTTYRVSLTQSVRDIYGKPLANAFSSSFTTADAVRVDNRLKAEKIKVNYPDSNGLARILIPAGAVPEGSVIIAVNTTSGATASTIAGTAAFEFRLQAQVGDEIVLTVRQPDGTEYSVTQGAYLRDDGYASVGASGGTLTSADGSVVLFVPQGAISGLAHFKLTPKGESDMTVPRVDELDPSNAPFGASVLLESQGSFNTREELHLELPAPEGLPANQPVAFLKPGKLSIDDSTPLDVWEMVTSGKVEGGRFKTTSPPFPGILPYAGIPLLLFVVVPNRVRAIAGNVTEAVPGNASKPLADVVLTISGHTHGMTTGQIVTRSRNDGTFAFLNFAIASSDTVEVVAFDLARTRTKIAVAARGYNTNTPLGPGIAAFTTLFVNVEFPSSLDDPHLRPALIEFEAERADLSPGQQDTLKTFGLVPVGATVVILATVTPSPEVFSGKLYVNNTEGEQLKWNPVPPPPGAPPGVLFQYTSFEANAEGNYSVLVTTYTRRGLDQSKAVKAFNFIALRNPNTRPPLPGPPSVLAVTPADKAAQVDSGTKVHLEFSEPVKNLSPGQSVYVEDVASGQKLGGKIISGGIPVAPGSNATAVSTIDFIPSPGLEGGKDYTVHVTSAVVDSDGNALDQQQGGTAGSGPQPFVSSFSTFGGTVLTDSPPQDNAYRIAAAGQFAATVINPGATGSFMRVYDMANPLSPALLSTVFVPHRAIGIALTETDPDAPDDAFKDGVNNISYSRIAVITTNPVPDLSRPTNLWIYSLEDPSDPRIIGVASLAFINTVTSIPGAVTIHGKRAYIGNNTHGGCFVVDIEKAINEWARATRDNVNNLARLNPQVQAVSPNQGFASDARVQSAPYGQSDAEPSPVLSVSVIDQTVFNPASGPAPVKVPVAYLGSPFRPSLIAIAFDPAKDGINGFFPGSSGFDDRLLTRTDVQPTDNVLDVRAVSGLTLGGQSTDLAVLLGFTRLWIFDVTNPGRPLQYTSRSFADLGIDNAGNARRMEVEGTTAYIIFTDRVVVIDFSDPEHPTRVATIMGVGNDMRYVTVKDGFIYTLGALGGAGDGRLNVSIGRTASQVLVHGFVANSQDICANPVVINRSSRKMEQPAEVYFQVYGHEVPQTSKVIIRKEETGGGITTATTLPATIQSLGASNPPGAAQNHMVIVGTALWQDPSFVVDRAATYTAEVVLDEKLPTEYHARPEPVPFSFLIGDFRASFSVRALTPGRNKGLYNYILGGRSKVELLVDGKNLLFDAANPFTRSYGVNADRIDFSPPLLDGVYPFVLRATLDGTTVTDEVAGEMTVADDPVDVRLPGTTVVNNVELSRGNLALSYTDVEVRNRGLSLGLTRSYNKAGADVFGPFGYGWQHNYQVLLIAFKTDPANLSYTMSGGDGSGQVFLEAHAVGGEMKAEDPYQGTLVKNQDGSFDYFTRAHVRYHFPGAIEEDSSTFYNAAYMGNLQYTEEPNGNRITLNYDTEGRMSRVTDSSNRSLDFEYELADTPFVGVLPPASTSGIACTNRRQFTIVRNRFAKAQFGRAWRVKTVKGPGMLEIDYSYDADGNLETVTRLGSDQLSQAALFNNKSFDSVWQYAYNPAPPGPPPPGQTRPPLIHVLKSVTSPNGANHTTVYDYHFDLFRMPVKSVTLPEGITNTFSYNYSQNRISDATVTDGRGNQTRYDFDVDGHATRMVGPRGLVTQMTWTRKGQKETETDPLGMTTTIRYDNADNPYSQTMAGSTGTTIQVTTTYDKKFSKPNLVVDGSGNPTQYTIDPKNGNVTLVTLRTGRFIKLDYDSRNGDLKKTVDENGLTTTYQYDAYGNPSVIEKETANGATVVTTNTFDLRSRLIKTENTLGPTIINTYDALDRIVQTDTIDPSGIRDPLTETYTYLKAGQVEVAVMDGGTQKTKKTYVYDNQERVTQLKEDVSGAGQFVLHYTYDNNSNLLTETDRRGVMRTYEYDALNFKTKTVVNGPFGASIPLETVDPDLLGHPKTITDRFGNTVEFTYDDLHRLVKRTLPGSYTEETGYDNNGNVTSTKDRNGRETVTQYDSVNRPTSQTDPAGRVTTWVYDDATRTVKMEMSPQGLTRFVQTDSLKRPLRDEVKFGANDYVTTYSYSGRTCRITDPRHIVTVKELSSFNEVGNLTVQNAVPPYSAGMRYSAFGGMKSSTDADTRTTTTELDGFNRTTKVKHPGGSEDVFVYDGEGNVLAYTDRRGSVSQMTYDNIARVLTTKVPDGATIIPVMTMTYDDGNSTEVMSDALNHATVMKYDGLRRVASVTDADGKQKLYEYDGMDLRGESDFKGVFTRYEYDRLDRVKQIIDREGKVTSITNSDNAGSTKLITNRRGFDRVEVYDPLMRLTSVEDGGQPVVSYEYDGNNNRTALTDGRGDRITYAYDLLNRVKTITYPDNLRTETFDYDAVGNVLTHSDGFSTVTQTYDPLDHLSTSTDGVGNTTTFKFDAEGLLLEKDDPKGNTYQTTYEYNALRSLTRVTDAKGGQWVYDYYPDQTLKTMTDAMHRVVSYEYDQLKRLKTSTQQNTSGTSPPSLVARFDYDENGNRQLVVDPKGQQTAVSYDRMDRQRSVTYSNFTGTSPQQHTFGYDPEGNLTSVDETVSTGSGPVSRRYERTYDARNRLDTATDPYGHKIDYDYDAADNITSFKDVAANTTTTYGYDHLNRLGQVVLPGNQSVTYTRKPNGLPETITYGSGMQRTYAYDQASRLTSITNAVGSQQSEEFDYTYDQNSNRATEAKKFNGSAYRYAEYEYDLLDRLSQVGYRDGNGLSGEYFDNADLTNPKLTRTDATVDFTWPGLNSPDPSIDSETFSVRWSGQVQPLYSETYTFYTRTDEGVRLWVNGQPLVDDWNNHQATEDSGTITLEAGKKYDITVEYFEGTGDAEAHLLWSSAHQTKQVIPPSQLFPLKRATDYTYDAAGNRLTESGRDINNVPINHTYAYDDLNRLTVARGYAGGDINYTYDNNGNLTQTRQANQVTGAYEYDVRDQLQRVLNGANQEVARYDYDFQRRRLSRTVAGGARLRYVYADDKIVSEFDSAGLLINRYDYGTDLLRGDLQGEGQRWYFDDGLGSVTALSLVDQQGARAAARYEYDAWGVPVAGGGSANQIGYTGQRLDSETGLMPLGNGERYYSPALGRFIQQDSWTGMMTTAQSMNRYAYVNGNPLRFTDPTGHDAVLDNFDKKHLQPAEHHGEIYKRYVETAGTDGKNNWYYNFAASYYAHSYYDLWNTVSFGLLDQNDTLVADYNSFKISEAEYQSGVAKVRIMGAVHIGVMAASAGLGEVAMSSRFIAENTAARFTVGAGLSVGGQFTTETAEISLGLRQDYSSAGSYAFNGVVGGGLSALEGVGSGKNSAGAGSPQQTMEGRMGASSSRAPQTEAETGWGSASRAAAEGEGAGRSITERKTIGPDAPGNRVNENETSLSSEPGAAAEDVPEMGRLCGRCFTEGTQVSTPDGQKNIEDLRVGERVVATNVSQSEPDGWTEVNPKTWRKLTLSMPDPDNERDTINIELLKPLSWMTETGAEAGKWIDFALPEVGLSGKARVVFIAECPPVKDGPGRVVLATLMHSSAVLDIRFEGLAEPVELTAPHYLFSLDRHAWVRAGELSPGERIGTRTGAARIESIQRHQGLQRVYNIGIETDSSYYVSALELLSHNIDNCGPWRRAEVEGRTVYQRDDLFDPTRRTSWQLDDETWRSGTNVERMMAGRAPVGVDGRPVQLHHLTQTEVNNFVGGRGSLVEISASQHSTNTSVLHFPRPKIPRYSSFRRDIEGALTRQAGEFDTFREDYWRRRARDF
jgi:RHS repeat-associated protein